MQGSARRYPSAVKTVQRVSELSYGRTDQAGVTTDLVFVDSISDVFNYFILGYRVANAGGVAQ